MGMLRTRWATAQHRYLSNAMCAVLSKQAMICIVAMPGCRNHTDLRQNTLSSFCDRQKKITSKCSLEDWYATICNVKSTAYYWHSHNGSALSSQTMQQLWTASVPANSLHFVHTIPWCTCCSFKHKMGSRLCCHRCVHEGMSRWGWLHLCHFHV